MKIVSASVRVAKLSSINLSDFFSVEVSIAFTSPNGSDVYVSISFLRHLDVLFSLLLSLMNRRTNGKWNVVDYSIYCGQDWDSMGKCSRHFKLSYVIETVICPQGSRRTLGLFRLWVYCWKWDRGAGNQWAKWWLADHRRLQRRLFSERWQRDERGILRIQRATERSSRRGTHRILAE